MFTELEKGKLSNDNQKSVANASILDYLKYKVSHAGDFNNFMVDNAIEENQNSEIAIPDFSDENEPNVVGGSDLEDENNTKLLLSICKFTN